MVLADRREDLREAWSHLNRAWKSLRRSKDAGLADEVVDLLSRVNSAIQEEGRRVEEIEASFEPNAWYLRN